ncbi:MAG TPA: hypothetical protein VFH54_03180 [Mycobacteriales bacterium]|nr:hypothetical protein [Mycobacteriales bacterium]
MPKAVRSDGEDASWFAAQYGLTLDGWQDACLCSWMGRRKDGRWSAATCGLAVARQNGKNGIIEVRELFGMVELGEKFLHSAHEVKTARKAFKRIKWFFGERANDPGARFPELNALVVEVRNTNGQEAIVLANGGSVEFVARSSGSGRGFTVDVLVLDEAQDLTDEELEAMLPTISAAPLGNPQVILTGTPPDAEKNQTGEVFARVRKDGENRRDKRLAWDDFGVPDGPLPDVNDRDLWYRTNPALGGRLNIAEVEREQRLMSPEGFARERLGWWGIGAAEPAEALVSPRRWGNLEDELATIAKVRAFSVEVTKDRKGAAIVAAGPVDETRTGVEVLPWSTDPEAARPDGIAWVLDRCRQLDATHGPAPFVIDAGGPAGSLIAPMQQAGLQVIIAGLKEITAATAKFIDAVADGTITHGPQAELDNAVRQAKKRPLGDGGCAISRKLSPVDVTALIAVTLAHWYSVMNRVPEVWSIREMVEQLRREQDQSAEEATRA